MPLSPQNSVTFLISVTLQLNTTCIPPILLMCPLALHSLFSFLWQRFLFFVRLITSCNYFLKYICTQHITGEQYLKAVLTNPLGKAGWCIWPRNTLFLSSGRWVVIILGWLFSLFPYQQFWYLHNFPLPALQQSTRILDMHHLSPRLI